ASCYLSITPLPLSHPPTPYSFHLRWRTSLNEVRRSFLVPFPLAMLISSSRWVCHHHGVGESNTDASSSARRKERVLFDKACFSEYQERVLGRNVCPYIDHGSNHQVMLWFRLRVRRRH